uniref:Uncharacterized protein n=1 Tax=mine drainage metagenome TaxID=410659 RepID=E6PCI3_9ZZZZ
MTGKIFGLNALAGEMGLLGSAEDPAPPPQPATRRPSAHAAASEPRPRNAREDRWFKGTPYYE